MLRQAFAARLKAAMKSRDAPTVSALRLVLAALKDRDVAARGQAGDEGITEPEILRLLQAMIKQRRESIALFEKGRRADLAEKERNEIAVIETFLPRQLGDAEIESAVRAAVNEVGAVGVKDVGRVMSLLRERHGGGIDAARAGRLARQLLG